MQIKQTSDLMPKKKTKLVILRWVIECAIQSIPFSRYDLDLDGLYHDTCTINLWFVWAWIGRILLPLIYLTATTQWVNSGRELWAKVFLNRVRQNSSRSTQCLVPVEPSDENCGQIALQVRLSLPTEIRCNFESQVLLKIWSWFDFPVQRFCFHWLGLV